MISDWEIIARLLGAAVLGGVVGFERERLLWAAGLRTHMLVCVGSALIIIVSAYGFNDVIGRNIKPIEERYNNRIQTHTLVVVAERDQFILDTPKEAAGPNARRIQQFVLKQTGIEEVDEAEVAFARLPEAAVREIAARIRALPGNRQVEGPNTA